MQLEALGCALRAGAAFCVRSRTPTHAHPQVPRRPQHPAGRLRHLGQRFLSDRHRPRLQLDADRQHCACARAGRCLRQPRRCGRVGQVSMQQLLAQHVRAQLLYQALRVFNTAMPHLQTHCINLSSRYGDGRESMAYVFDCAAWSSTCSTLAQVATNWLRTGPAAIDASTVPPPPASPAPLGPVTMEHRVLVLTTPGAY